MNILIRFFVIVLFLLNAYCALAKPSAGFSLPDDVQEITFKYQSVSNLIILPVTLNDTTKVNLILDTGCRNLVLFGRRFRKIFHTDPNHKIQFSGLGNGKAVEGKLSLENKVSIHAVLGEKIPVVLVEHQNLFSTYSNVHGVIGYDIFIKFEIELNTAKQLITFRPAAIAELSPEFKKIPIRIKDARPLIYSKIFMGTNDGEACDLMLDTGSSLGLLLKTTDLNKFPKGNKKIVLGRGLNGDVVGIETPAEKLVLETFEIHRVFASITYSAWHNYASIGMEILKDYTLVLNYCKAYAGLKKSI